jgi:glycosyltransferase involved in cell wall biosynthesis
MALKLVLLRYTQSSSYRRADGVIFLTDYAKQAVLKVTGQLSARVDTIPHGISRRFQLPAKEHRLIGDYNEANPFRLLYVSIVDQYKHQWHVIEAVHTLRAQGLPVVLELVGPAYPTALARLQASMEKFDPQKLWVHYHGAIPYENLNSLYAKADLGVFASSCENMPNILLETMASGLPVACSNRGPMPEVLGEAGLYFDPESPVEIVKSLLKYIDSPALRSEKAKGSLARCRQYTWERCADETLAFLADVVRGDIKR